MDEDVGIAVEMSGWVAACDIARYMHANLRDVVWYLRDRRLQNETARDERGDWLLSARALRREYDNLPMKLSEYAAEREDFEQRMRERSEQREAQTMRYAEQRLKNKWGNRVEEARYEH